MDGKSTIQATFLLFFSLAFSYFAYDLFTLLNNAVDKTTYPVGNALMWTGYIIATIMITLVGPLLIALQREGTNLFGFLYGYITYVCAALITMVSWGFVQVIIAAIQNIGVSVFVGQFLYFMSIIFYVTLLFLVPLFITFNPDIFNDYIKHYIME